MNKRHHRLGLAGLGLLLAASPLACSSDFSDEQEIVASIGTTYQVGPGKPYADLQSVATRLAPGDVVEVYGQSSAYPGNLVLSRSGTSTSKITIRGIPQNGRRPVISGGTNTIEFRADSIVFEGFEVTGGSGRCIFHHGHDITIRDSIIHDCPGQGLLGAEADSGSLTMEYVEVYRCGNGDRQHPIYMATDESTHPGAVFRMQHCYLHDQNGGNNVKSRAQRNEIYYNWIEGGTYRELELIGPDDTTASPREDADVVGNVLYKRQGTFGVRVGSDTIGFGESQGRYRFVNNVFIMQPASASAVQVYGAIDSIEMHNNVFYKVGGGGVSVMRSDSGGSYGQSGANNWVASGSSNVPSVWTGTITGTDPGFVNVTGNDLRLTSSSALLNRGVTTTVSPSGHSFPSPLALPLYHPPMRRLEVAGTALARTIVGSGPDLGAYEYGTAVSTPTTGTGGTGGTTGSTGGTGGTTGSTGGTGGTTTSTTCLTASASTTWQAIPFAAKTGTFTAEADVTPLAGDIDGGVALSNGATSSWKNLASIVLFHPTGKIFARNGGAYTAGSIGYSANVTYHIRLVVDMAANTYSAYVRPAGGTEQTIGTGLAFRTEQTDVPQLSSMTLPLDQGSMRICNPTVR